jgi:hypothetical protein
MLENQQKMEIDRQKAAMVAQSHQVKQQDVKSRADERQQAAQLKAQQMAQQRPV